MLRKREGLNWRCCEPHEERMAGQVNVSLVFSGVKPTMGDMRGNGVGSSCLPTESSKKRKAKDGQTKNFPSGFKERPIPDGAGPKALAL